jgi:hypothetical protein
MEVVLLLPAMFYFFEIVMWETVDDWGHKKSLERQSRHNNENVYADQCCFVVMMMHSMLTRDVTPSCLHSRKHFAQFWYHVKYVWLWKALLAQQKSSKNTLFWPENPKKWWPKSISVGCWCACAFACSLLLRVRFCLHNNCTGKNWSGYQNRHCELSKPIAY